MLERHEKAFLVLAPARRAGRPSPLRLRWHSPPDWSHAQRVKLALQCHSFDCKSQCVPCLDSSNAEVEPSSEVTNIRVGQPITVHVTGEMP